MMSVGDVAALFLLIGFSTMGCGHVMSSASSTPSSGEKQLQQFQEIKQMLTTIQQAQSVHQVQSAQQSLCSAVGSRSDVELIKNKLMTLETKLLTMETKQGVMETRQGATDTALQSTQVLFKSKMESGAGSTFVRWGRKSCTNSSQVVYTGVAGGSHYSHSGAAVNMLCLTLEPQSDGTPSPPYYGYLYGAEYEHIDSHHEHDVPCSVCRAAQSTTIMIPSTHACPVDWTTQYTGTLVTGRYLHKAASEYTCLDGNPEDESSGVRNDNGYLLYRVIAQCGSLPCPPYVHGQVVLCVVCSK